MEPTGVESRWQLLITIGLSFQLATFSASLNNLMGASRVMEAVAKDILFGPFLAFVARGTVGDNPVAAVLVTWVFIEMFLLMGALNTIAQVFKLRIEIIRSKTWTTYS